MRIAQCVLGIQIEKLWVPAAAPTLPPTAAPTPAPTPAPKPQSNINVGKTLGDNSYVANGVVNPLYAPGSPNPQNVTAYTSWLELFISLSGGADQEYLAIAANSNAAVLAYASHSPIFCFRHCRKIMCAKSRLYLNSILHVRAFLFASFCLAPRPTPSRITAR
jgi:hypothetical protein